MAVPQNEENNWQIYKQEVEKALVEKDADSVKTKELVIIHGNFMDGVSPTQTATDLIKNRLSPANYYQ